MGLGLQDVPATVIMRIFTYTIGSNIAMDQMMRTFHDLIYVLQMTQSKLQAEQRVVEDGQHQCITLGIALAGLTSVLTSLPIQPNLDRNSQLMYANDRRRVEAVLTYMRESSNPHLIELSLHAMFLRQVMHLTQGIVDAPEPGRVDGISVFRIFACRSMCSMEDWVQQTENDLALKLRSFGVHIANLELRMQQTRRHVNSYFLAARTFRNINSFTATSTEQIWTILATMFRDRARLAMHNFG